MTLFAYRAIDAKGRRVKGSMDAMNPVDLELRLSRLGLDMVAAHERRQAGWFGAGKIGRRDLITFCFHLEQLSRAGVPLLEGLADLRDSVENPRFRDVVGNLIDEIEGGRQLSEALALHPQVFDTVFVHLIHAGEVSGQLPAVLLELTDMLKWQDELAAQMKKIIMYPSFVAVTVLAAVTFLMVYLVPQLVQFIKTMNQQLPLHTKALIALSDFMVKYWPYVLTSPFVLFFVISAWAARDPKMRYRVDSWMLSLPVVGGVLRKIILARFSTFFAMMYASGITILDSLEVSKGVVGNSVIAEGLGLVRETITEGQGVAASFERARLFPPLVVRMIRVGENTGGLDTALRSVSYFYDRDVKESISRVQTLIEPTLTVILGVILGWVMLSVLGPIYDIITKIKM